MCTIDSSVHPLLSYNWRIRGPWLDVPSGLFVYLYIYHSESDVPWFFFPPNASYHTSKSNVLLYTFTAISIESNDNNGHNSCTCCCSHSHHIHMGCFHPYHELMCPSCLLHVGRIISSVLSTTFPNLCLNDAGIYLPTLMTVPPLHTHYHFCICIQHLGAGIVLSAVATELLPTMSAESSSGGWRFTAATLIGFFLGR